LAVQSQTAAEQLAAFSVSVAFEEIPDEVVRAAKNHLLDVVGCGLAAHALDNGAAAREVVVGLEGPPEASLIGASQRVPAPSAALANGMLMHALDFDDTHSESIAHVSTVVAPAAIAAAENRSCSGRELLAAIVAGGEIVARIGAAASGGFHARGFHPTAAAGVFGATAAAARLDGLGPAAAASALGLAGSTACGLFAYLDAGTATKPFHAGWAAHAGVLVARLAAAGAEGPANVLEGRFGLYDAFVGRVPDLDSQLADLGERWETLRIAFKAYPACHFMHGVLDAAASLRDVEGGEIADILVSVPADAVALVLEPEATKVAPRTSYDAKFSLQYSLAALLLQRSLDVRSYLPSAIADPDALSLARRVRYEVRDFPSYPAAFPGAVAITLTSGEVLEAAQPHQLGGPDNPLDQQSILRKFRANASLTLAEDDARALERDILELEDAPLVSAVFGRLGLAAEVAAP